MLGLESSEIPMRRILFPIQHSEYLQAVLRLCLQDLELNMVTM